MQAKFALKTKIYVNLTWWIGLSYVRPPWPATGSSLNLQSQIHSDKSWNFSFCYFNVVTRHTAFKTETFTELTSTVLQFTSFVRIQFTMLALLYLSLCHNYTNDLQTQYCWLGFEWPEELAKYLNLRTWNTAYRATAQAYDNCCWGSLLRHRSRVNLKCRFFSFQIFHDSFLADGDFPGQQNSGLTRWSNVPLRPACKW